MNKFFMMAAAMLGMSAQSLSYVDIPKVDEAAATLRASRYKQEPLSRNASQRKRRKLVRQNPHLLRSKKFKR